MRLAAVSPAVASLVYICFVFMALLAGAVRCCWCSVRLLCAGVRGSRRGCWAVRRGRTRLWVGVCWVSAGLGAGPAWARRKGIGSFLAQFAEEGDVVQDAHVGFVVDAGVHDVEGEEAFDDFEQVVGFPGFFDVVVDAAVVDGVDGVGVGGLPGEEYFAGFAKAAVAGDLAQ